MSTKQNNDSKTILRKYHIPRKRVQTHTVGPSKTKQSPLQETDINFIVKKSVSNGHLPMMMQEARYGDFSEPTTYQDALNTVIVAQNQFAALPSHVRERFGNNPEHFLRFTADPKNAAEMVKLGLATERPTPPQPLTADAIGEATAQAIEAQKEGTPSRSSKSEDKRPKRP